MTTLILSIVILNFVLDLAVETLNLKNFPLTPEFLRRRNYLRENLLLGFIEQAVHIVFWIVAFNSPFLNSTDQALSQIFGNTVWQGAFWLLAVGGIKMILSLPFQVWSTFSIESRYGFNTTTAQTFCLDRLKGLGLTLILGAPILALLLFLFEITNLDAWWISWLTMSGISLVFTYLAPVLLFPLFNRFEALPEGSLRSKIQSYADSQGFSMSGTFVMDGSKRSTKRNAFFTGFGKTRKLVLFDTLINNHSEEEILAVVAHEMGHFKLHHIPKMMVISILTQGILFWMLGRFVADPQTPVWVQQTLGLEQPRLAGVFLLISLLYIPVSKVLSVTTLALSRKHEFEADDYSKKSFGNLNALVSALRKMEEDHLSHPNPHRLKILLEYSHPPVSQREAALRA